MGYQEDRQRRVDIFEHTIRYCERNRTLLDSVTQTRAGTQLYRQPLEECRQWEPRFAESARVTVTRRRTLEAAGVLSREYEEHRIGILNFASATNPGGGVIRGSNAQEECLCRCSTLYPCLTTDMLWQEYYQFHQKRDNALYTSACIYLPEVMIFKKDIPMPELMKPEDWFWVDVISCAAPNLRERPSNHMNPMAGNRLCIGEEELLKLMENRIRGILMVAAANKVDVLILGVGCGAFRHSPHMVAKAYQNVLNDFEYTFRAVEFAIYCSLQDTENHDVFSAQLNDVF